MFFSRLDFGWESEFASCALNVIGGVEPETVVADESSADNRSTSSKVSTRGKTCSTMKSILATTNQKLDHQWLVLTVNQNLELYK